MPRNHAPHLDVLNRQAEASQRRTRNLVCVPLALLIVVTCAHIFANLLNH